MAPDNLERLATRKDPALLLRQQCYVDGQWRDADDGATHTVSLIPLPTGRAVRTAPKFLGGEDVGADRGRRPRVARVVRQGTGGAKISPKWST